MENILSLENDVELNNVLTNEKTREAQRSFLESNLGKAINTGVDIALKTMLPNLIKDQVIDVKNTILEHGFSAGLNEAINSSIDLGKSAIGIFTGNFENIYQAERAIEKGGVLDTVSKLIDTSVTSAKKAGVLNKEISKVIKEGKNIVVESLKEKIGQSFKEQVRNMEKLDQYCKTWNIHYQNQDFSKMEYSYKQMEKYLESVMPMENTINEAKRIENLHNLIKNNGKDFNITDSHLELSEKLADI